MAIVACLLILIAAAGLGHKLMGFVFAKEETSSERVMLGLGLGLGILAYAVYAIGLIGLINTYALIAIIVIPAIVCHRDIIQVTKSLIRGTMGCISILAGKYGWLNASIGYLFCGTAMFNLIGALAPEIIFDAIWYHLTMPKYYLLSHRVYYIDFLTYGVFPRNIEMLFTLAMGLGGDIAVKLLHFSFGLVVAAAIFIFGRKYIGRDFAFMAAAIFYMMSNVNMLSATAYIDLGLTLFEVLAAASLLFWAEDRRKAWLILAGIFLGLSLGSKHQAMLLVLVMVILVIAAEVKLGKGWLKRAASSVAIISIPALLLAAPWYIDAFIHTRNPVYPLFNELFGTGESFEQAMFAGTNKTSWYDGHSLLDFILMPWKLTMGTFEGWLSPLIIISLPLLLLVRRPAGFLRSWLWYSLLFYLAYFAIVPFYTMRYFLPAVPVLSLIVAYLFGEAMKTDRWLKMIVTAVLLLVFAANLGFVAVKNMPSAKAAMGLQDRSAYLDETLGWYAVNGYIDSLHDPKVKVLVNGAPLFYYFEFPFEYGNGPAGYTVEEKYQRRREAGFTHVMALVGEITDPTELEQVELVFQAEQPPGARSNAARSVRLYKIKYRDPSAEGRD